MFVTCFRVFGNEGYTENGYKTLKIRVLDHFSGIFGIWTSIRFISFAFGVEFSIFIMQKTSLSKRTKYLIFLNFESIFVVNDWF